ncbi:hypothetical protein HD806DRAFT_547449 [Xylariaceae sp. AK1471]|nr:hypothetical protein HD806DRAFT_547449 [Xylariaceae sp. AK1471]
MDSKAPDTRGMEQPFPLIKEFIVIYKESRSQPIVMIGNTPSDALAHGLEPLRLGYEEVMLSTMHQNISTLVQRKMRLQALQSALEYACNWAFVTGYKIVFDARIGLTPVAGSVSMTLAVFLSFSTPKTDTPATYATGHQTRWTVQATTIQEYEDAAGTEGASPSQQGAKTKTSGISRATKRWVVERVLHLLMRCYGRTPFPRSIWFMEDCSDGSAPTLLLPYTLNLANDDHKNINDSMKRITRQVAGSVPVANPSDDGEEMGSNSSKENTSDSGKEFMENRHLDQNNGGLEAWTSADFQLPGCERGSSATLDGEDSDQDNGGLKLE